MPESGPVRAAPNPGQAAEGNRAGCSIDDRHLVGALKRKPCAFARWVLRDAAFPCAVYRQTWERLSVQQA